MWLMLTNNNLTPDMQASIMIFALINDLVLYFYVEGLLYVPSPKCAYSASKHGVVGFTRCYAKVRV